MIHMPRSIFNLQFSICNFQFAILTVALWAQSAAFCADDPPETVPPPSKTVPAQVPELLKEAAAAAREIGETGPAAYALLEIAVVMADSDKAGAAALVDEALQLFPRVKASG